MSNFQYMVVSSVRIGADQVKGTKSYNAKGILPSRMRYFNPAGAVDLLGAAAQLGLVFSDMARTPEAQVHAKRTRSGSQTPDRSGHVRLLSFDLDVDATLKAGGYKTKRQLDNDLEEFRFYCHRRDHRRAAEDWHYNWLPDFPKWYQNESRTNPALQRYIDFLFGKWHTMDKITIQRALASLKLYSGDIDGDIGPLTKTGVEMFQRAYFLKPDGIPGPATQRMLAVVTATYSDGVHT